MYSGRPIRNHMNSQAQSVSVAFATSSTPQQIAPHCASPGMEHVHTRLSDKLQNQISVIPCNNSKSSISGIEDYQTNNKLTNIGNNDLLLSESNHFLHNQGLSDNILMNYPSLNPSPSPVFDSIQHNNINNQISHHRIPHYETPNRHYMIPNTQRNNISHNNALNNHHMHQNGMYNSNPYDNTNCNMKNNYQHSLNQNINQAYLPKSNVTPQNVPHFSHYNTLPNYHHGNMLNNNPYNVPNSQNYQNRYHNNINQRITSPMSQQTYFPNIQNNSNYLQHQNTISHTYQNNPHYLINRHNNHYPQNSPSVHGVGVGVGVVNHPTHTTSFKPTSTTTSTTDSTSMYVSSTSIQTNTNTNTNTVHQSPLRNSSKRDDHLHINTDNEVDNIAKLTDDLLAQDNFIFNDVGVDVGVDEIDVNNNITNDYFNPTNITYNDLNRNILDDYSDNLNIWSDITLVDNEINIPSNNDSISLTNNNTISEKSNITTHITSLDPSIDPYFSLHQDQMSESPIDMKNSEILDISNAFEHLNTLDINSISLIDLYGDIFSVGVGVGVGDGIDSDIKNSIDYFSHLNVNELSLINLYGNEDIVDVNTTQSDINIYTNAQFTSIKVNDIITPKNNPNYHTYVNDFNATKENLIQTGSNSVNSTPNESLLDTNSNNPMSKYENLLFMAAFSGRRQ